jgi:toxin ParE1/3/4
MKIIWTKRALYNLEALSDYIAQHNRQAASKMVKRLAEAVDILLEYPEIGRVGNISGTRELVVRGTPYVIPYRIIGYSIEILSVLHGSQNWPDHF